MVDKKTIDEVVNRLVKTYNPLEIYLFGSYAWGNPDEESDLDILVIVESWGADRFKAMSEGHRALIGMNIAKDILLLSKQEFQESILDGQVFYTRIKSDGKKIYARA